MTQIGEAERTRDIDSRNIFQLLDHDPRPTFVLDLKAVHKSPIFCNKALRADHRACAGVLDQRPAAESLLTQDDSQARFWRWATSNEPLTAKEDSSHPFLPYLEKLWTRFVFRDTFVFISATPLDLAVNQDTKLSSYSIRDAEPLHQITNGSTPRQSNHSDQHTYVKRSKGSGSESVSPDTKSIRDASPEINSKPIWAAATTPNGTVDTDPMLALSKPEMGVPDCTASNPDGVLSAHVIFFRSLDWASTPLGAMDTWSREFRQVVNLMMGNPHPASLFWGNELTMLYNEAYAAEVAGIKHPALLGTGFAGPFKEIWEGVRPLFVECARTGTSIRKDNDVLFMERRGYIEETYFSWSWTPLYGSGSKILGFYNAPFETTGYCVGLRRTQTLQRLNQSISTAKSVPEFWQCALNALEDNPFDIPFALLYSAERMDDFDHHDDASWNSASVKVVDSCVLEGSIGIPSGHIAAPQRIRLDEGDESWTPSLRKAMQTRESTLLQTSDGTLSEDLIQGLWIRGFGDPCKEAVVLPLWPTNSDGILSFLLLGCNPRVRYDDEYKSFTNLMSRQLATSLASILLFEEETRRSKIEQEQLNRQLAVQTDRLKRMTAQSPLGMFYMDPNGMLLEANDRYFEMTGQRRDELYEMSWMNQLVTESKLIMEQGWKKLTVELQPFSAELHLDKQCIDTNTRSTESIDYWVLTNAYPELTPDGKLRSIMGSITDISHLKWAQGLQDRRLREAEETRRQQNEFIDITSHEMRNPMSAVLQCADDIASTLAAHRDDSQESIRVILDDCIELASTITLCVQHQKTIVDDILTVSKLDSNLVVLTPVSVQPVHVVRQIVKLFEPEFVSKKIDFDFVLDPSFPEMGIEWILMDPSRVSQIVINFMTNAIKFMNGREKRQITMYMGASAEPPIPRTADFVYIPRKPIKHHTLFEDNWGNEEMVYLRLKVQDTGCGLTQEEKQLLFQRFQQASPRTHAQYGGSGLGLFISRQLTELHGGQIGVASFADVGSTFGFFIKTRRTSKPETPVALFANTSMSPWPGKHGAAGLPVISPDAIQVKDPRDNSRSPINGSISPQPQAGTISILVVEDNLVNQRVLVKQLRKAGCSVEVAGNGQLALDFLQKTSFWTDGGLPLTAVLMDLEMPVMDGLTCVREIRKLQAEGTIRKHVPVIAITANVRQEQISAAKACGMDDVVSKPFRIPDVLVKIKAVLKTLNQEAVHI